MNGWLLSTIQTILQSSQNQLGKTEPHTNLAANIQTCLDMLDSVGVVLAMGIIKAAATSLVELTVARKDSILRKIPNISSDLKEKLRQLPLVWETNRPETGDDPGLLFRGRSDMIASDRKLEADKPTRQPVLKLQSLRSAPKQLKCRQSGPEPRPEKIKVSPQNQPFPAPQRGCGRSNSTRGSSFHASLGQRYIPCHKVKQYLTPQPPEEVVSSSGHVLELHWQDCQALGAKPCEHFTQGAQTGFHRNTKIISSTHLCPASKVATEGTFAEYGNKQTQRREQ